MPLAKGNAALSLPSMAVRDDVVYAAYRSFDLLRFSNQLQVVAYDLKTHKELQRVAISVPRVHGARASDGLFLSEDGQTLAYAELHEPGLIVLLGTKNLAEIKRSDALPFAPQDHQRVFAGFDHDQLCIASNFYQAGKPDVSGLHFIRLGLADLKPTADTKATGVWQETSGRIVWLPKEHKTWVNPPGKPGVDVWTEYTEAGQKTGQATEHRNGLSNGAVALGDGKLLAFYGNMVAKGAIVSYADHHVEELKLECTAHPYGLSTDPAYAGGICTTQRDILPEAGANKVRSSEFLLLRPGGPTILWRHNMDFLGVANGNEPDAGFQKGDPLIYPTRSKIVVMAPSKSSSLMVYEIAAP
jgi:hypothetical protein